MPRLYMLITLDHELIGPFEGRRHALDIAQRNGLEGIIGPAAHWSQRLATSAVLERDEHEAMDLVCGGCGARGRVREDAEALETNYLTVDPETGDIESYDSDSSGSYQSWWPWGSCRDCGLEQNLPEGPPA